MSMVLQFGLYICPNHPGKRLFHPPRYWDHLLASKHPYCKRTSKKIFKREKSDFLFIFHKIFPSLFKKFKKIQV